LDDGATDALDRAAPYVSAARWHRRLDHAGDQISSSVACAGTRATDRLIRRGVYDKELVRSRSTPPAACRAL